jgi:hypothetical protein
MLLIGFGNKARHGKDSAAQAITNYYTTRPLHWGQRPLKVETFKYATALYAEVNQYLSCSPADKNAIWPELANMPDWVQLDPQAEKSPLAPYGKHPKLLQYWGTEYRRAQDPEYWIKKMFASIPANLDVAMITDVRFPNEFAAIKERGGYNIRVNRKNANGAPFIANDRPADHPSETALDNAPWDFEIDSPHGHVALAGEIAITITEYLRGLSAKTK